jgi:uncharacterized membrane protein
MPIHLVCLVLFAALLHASWNALLRGGADRLWSMTVMCIAIAITCSVAAAFMPIPASESWGYALLSALLHVGYNLFLVRSYRVGDLGQVYPISRGSSPALITLGAAVFAGERIAPGQLLGTRWSPAGSFRWPSRGAACRFPACLMRWAPAASSRPTASSTASVPGSPARRWLTLRGCAPCGAC